MTTVAVGAVRLDEVQRRAEHLDPEARAGRRGRWSGSRCCRARRPASAAARRPEPASSPARRRRAWVNARLVGGHEVEGARPRPATSPRPARMPGQAERGRGDVVGVGAGAHDVERLGDVGVAAGLAGERQRQLGRQLAGHLAVDRVERALRLGRRRRRARATSPDIQTARHSHGSSLSSVAHGVVDPVELPGLERGPGPGEQHLGAVRRGTLEGGQALRRGRRCSRCAATASAGRRRRRAAGAGPASRASRRRPSGTSKSRDDVECSAAPSRPAATTSRSTPSSCTRSSSAETNRSAGSGGAGLEQQAVERVVLAEQRRVVDRRERGDVGALVAAELHGQHGQRAADRVDVGRDGRADVRHLGRLVARWCRRSRSRGRRARRTPPRSISLTASPTWMTLSGLKSQ